MTENNNKKDSENEDDTHIAIFSGKAIRRTWFAER